MSSDKHSDDDIKHLLKRSPSKIQKVTKYALFCSSVIVTLISGESYIIVTCNNDRRNIHTFKC